MMNLYCLNIYLLIYYKYSWKFNFGFVKHLILKINELESII